MEESKYKLIPSDKAGLFRIVALRDFSDVKEGDIGGYISGEHNLSHEGKCWVYGNAIVRDNAMVYENAKVYGNAIVRDKAEVYGNSEVYGKAMVSDKAYVFCNAKVYDNAQVYGDTSVFNNASIYGDSKVCGNAEVSGDATIHDNSWVYDYAQVYGNVEVYDNAEVGGNAIVLSNAKVCGNACVDGYTGIYGNAIIKEKGDYIVFHNTWSSGRYFTWTRSNDMWKVGCFYGTGDELIKKAYKDSELSGKMYEMHVDFVRKMTYTKEKFSGKITNN
jgi:carbonic anhydrase/acetyltransferase-like protein (isoleucine patch superfamily)